MKKIIDPFTDYLPKIDVHGCDRDYTIYKLNELIEDNLKLRNYHIVIIHGKGQNILKDEIHSYLKKDKRVASFNLNPLNIGMTEIFLNK